MLRDELSSATEALLVPIDGASLVGLDPGLDADFEIIKKEIDRLTSVDGTPPNWKLIVKLSEDVLRGRAKDLRVATWWAAARVHTDSFRGFAAALLLYQQLCERYWDSMFPELKRMRGRANLYAWLTEQAYLKLDPMEPTADDAEAVRLAESLVHELDGFLADKLGDLHPGPGRLRGMFRSKLAALPAPTVKAPEVAAPVEAPPAEPTPAPPTPSAPPSGPTAPAPPVAVAPKVAVTVAAPPANVDLAGVDGALGTCGAGIRQVAKALHDSDNTDPRPYRLLRLGLWLGLNAAPAAERGRTRVRAPDRSYLDDMAGCAKNSDWPGLLGSAEAAAARHIFWLDPHRAVAVAMDQLGPTYAAAREEVGRAVVDLVRRVPELPELAFGSGLPFAGPETRQWLDSERSRWAGGTVRAGPADPLEEGLQRANALLKDGKLGEALTAAKEAAVRSGSHRDRFRGLLRTSRMAMESGAVAFARAILEGLLKDVDAHVLEEWDPALCAALYTDLLIAMRSEPGPETVGTNVDRTTRQALIFEKLCRIDPRAALELARR